MCTSARRLSRSLAIRPPVVQRGVQNQERSERPSADVAQSQAPPLGARCRPGPGRTTRRPTDGFEDLPLSAELEIGLLRPFNRRFQDGQKLPIRYGRLAS